MSKKNTFFVLLVVLIVCFVSCRGTSLDMDENLSIHIQDGMRRDLIEEFIHGNNQYIIKGDKIYCSDLQSKVNLKRYLIFMDSFFNTTSVSYVVVNFRSEKEIYQIPSYYSENVYSVFYGMTEIYFPAGSYKILVDNPMEELTKVSWNDDYVSDENFVDSGYLIFCLKYSIVDEVKIKSLKLDDVMLYFDDGDNLLGRTAEGMYVLDPNTTIFDDYEINYATLLAFLLDNGFYVNADCESGLTIIDLY